MSDSGKHSCSLMNTHIHAKAGRKVPLQIPQTIHFRKISFGFISSETDMSVTSHLEIPNRSLSSDRERITLRNRHQELSFFKYQYYVISKNKKVPRINLGRHHNAELETLFSFCSVLKFSAICVLYKKHSLNTFIVYFNSTF